MWEDVRWEGGPHDGLEQLVLADQGPLRYARVCACHGALYLATVDDSGWVLHFAESIRDGEQRLATESLA